MDTKTNRKLQNNEVVIYNREKKVDEATIKPKIKILIIIILIIIILLSIVAFLFIYLKKNKNENDKNDKTQGNTNNNKKFENNTELIDELTEITDELTQITDELTEITDELTEIINCDNGYFLPSDGERICQKCQVDNCAICSGTKLKNECTLCNTGFKPIIKNNIIEFCTNCEIGNDEKCLSW